MIKNFYRINRGKKLIALVPIITQISDMNRQRPVMAAAALPGRRLTTSMRTVGISMLPPMRSSWDRPPRTATTIRVSNLATTDGFSSRRSSAVPPTGTTPNTGLTVRPSIGLTSVTCRDRGRDKRLGKR